MFQINIAMDKYYPLNNFEKLHYICLFLSLTFENVILVKE